MEEVSWGIKYEGWTLERGFSRGQTELTFGRHNGSWSYSVPFRNTIQQRMSREQRDLLKISDEYTYRESVTKCIKENEAVAGKKLSEFEVDNIRKYLSRLK